MFNTKTTLLLLAVTGALLGFILVYERKLPKSWQAPEREKYLLAFDRNNVEGIDIFSNEDKVELRKNGNQWMVQTPVKDRASLPAVNEILTLCETLEKEPLTGAGNGDKKQLKMFGVAKPAVRLKLLGREMPPEILFGKDTAVEGKVYVRLDGSGTVAVTDNTLRNAIVRKPDEFRDPRLSMLDSSIIKRVFVKTAAGEIALTKESRRWSVVKPLKARADDATVAAFLESVLHTQIAGFLPDNNVNLNSYGLSEPRGVVTFEAAGMAPAVLEIGARDEKSGGVYGRFSLRGGVLLLPPASEKILGLVPNDLRERKLARIEMDLVDRITLRPDGKPPVVLRRQREQWLVHGMNPGDARDADKAKVQQMVKELQTRNISAFVTDVASDLARYGLDQPQLRVTFSSYASENTAETNAGEQPLLTIAFGKTEGDIVYVRVEGEPFVVAVDKAVLGEMNLSTIEWRARALFRFRQGEIFSISVTNWEGDKPQLPISLVLRGSEWAFEDHSYVVGLLNRTNIQSFLGTLSRLTAFQWTSDPGPVNPAQTIEFATAAGKLRKKLILGAPAQDGSCLGMVYGEQGIFRLSAPDASALRLPLVDPL